MKDKKNLELNLKESKKDINNFIGEISTIMNILNIVKENYESFYELEENLINNYEQNNRNYEVLNNINQIINNNIIKDINNINNDKNIENKFKNIVKIYNIINSNENNN